jgi:rhamnogalacturonan endolyase
VNFGTDPRGLWDDAKQRQQAEAKKWPYSWVDAPEYEHPRGTVTGRWHLTSGPAKQGARVILAEPGGDWPAQGKKYEFFTKTGADGRFTIPNVIPGTYTLYLSGADQPQDWSRDQIEVKANQVTDLGVLDWKPVQHGRTLWQIGTFDRTAAEFRGGDDARHFEMFKKYPEQFPQDVDFKIGTSDIKKDWNYAQWSWYSKTPVWKIRFPGPAQARGKAYLTLGFASAQPIKGNQTNLEVKVNGQLVDTVHLPKTGTAGYRGSAQDSQYNVRTLVFDAALLHPGENVITLGHADAVPFSELKPDVEFGVGQVMYDAIRLEVGE